MYDYVDIGSRIFMLRTSKGIKQREMGNKLGITQPAYSDLETGKREMTLAQLYKIAETLDVSPVWLMEPDTEVLTDIESLQIEQYKRFLISQRSN